MKYEKTINVIILIKLLKWHYTSFYIDIHVYKQLSFILQFMFSNSIKK